MIHVENVSRIIILDLSLDFQTYYMVLNLGTNKITSLLLSLKKVFPMFMYVFNLTFFIPRLCCTIQCSVTISHSAHSETYFIISDCKNCKCNYHGCYLLLHSRTQEM